MRRIETVEKLLFALILLIWASNRILGQSKADATISIKEMNQNAIA